MKMFNMRMTDEMYENLKKLSKLDNRTMAGSVRTLLEAFFKKKEKENV